MITATPLYFMFENSFTSDYDSTFQILFIIGNMFVMVGIIGEAMADE